MSSEIEHLKSAGRYREAARLLLERGEALAAAHLLAEVWDYAGALSVAREAGALADAYRYAVEAKDDRACLELRSALEHGGDENDLRALTDFAIRRNRHEDAAHFCLWSEDSLAAARHFAAAGRPLVAAKLLVTRGRAGDGAEILARAYKREPAPEVALGLAQALVALGRHRKALDIVQPVRMPNELFSKQQRLIATCLRALGLEGAAENVEARFGATRASKVHGIRYLSLGEGTRLYDRWLRVACQEEFSIGASRRQQLLSFARVVHPNVQQIFDLSEERALLELGSGVRLGDIDLEERALRVSSLLYQLDDALRALAHAQVAHGAVDEGHIYVEHHRLVLMIPDSPMPSATEQADRGALAQLRRRMLLSGASSMGGSAR